PDLISAIENGGDRVGLAAGQRIGRKDTGFKKIQSRIANGVRNAILRDGTRDTGCGLKAFRREVFLALPYFDGLHRFLPALVRREGYEIAYVEVIDRPRRSGVSNYGFFDRLWIGIMVLAGVWWLIRRKKSTPGVHRRPGAWAPGLRAQSVFHHRQWTAIIGERLSARELSAPSMSNRSDDTFACPGGRGEGSGAIGLAAKVDVSNRRFQCSPLFGRQAE